MFSVPGDRRAPIILTYHAIADGEPPLYLDPDVFRRHLDCIVESRALTVTVRDLAAALRAGTLPDRVVAMTFDDGFASVASEAAPLLRERDLVATVFCVAGYLGRTNDWPTQPGKAPRATLAGSAELHALVEAGFEIGAHGMDHAPLNRGSEAFLRREIVESKTLLEDIIGAEICSFAYPYGAPTTPFSRALVEEAYTAACTTRISRVDAHADPFALPRIDAHYVRRPQILSGVIRGRLDSYLGVRRTVGGLRRRFLRDYA